MQCHDEHMKELNRKAKRVIAGWNEKAGVSGMDDLDSDEDSENPDFEK